MTVHADVTSPEAVDAAFAAVEQAWGPVEILVNGGRQPGQAGRPGRATTTGRTRSTPTSPVRSSPCAALRPMIKARFGRIVSVSSIVAATGSPGQANYAAAKAGLVGMSRSMPAEVATRNVTVNVVEPGPSPRP